MTSFFRLLAELRLSHRPFRYDILDSHWYGFPRPAEYGAIAPDAVHDHDAVWREGGTWERVTQALRESSRRTMGRSPQPSLKPQEKLRKSADFLAESDPLCSPIIPSDQMVGNSSRTTTEALWPHVERW